MDVPVQGADGIREGQASAPLLLVGRVPRGKGHGNGRGVPPDPLDHAALSLEPIGVPGKQQRVLLEEQTRTTKPNLRGTTNAKGVLGLL